MGKSSKLTITEKDFKYTQTIVRPAVRLCKSINAVVIEYTPPSCDT